MGASDLDNYGFDADEARYNRMNRQILPQVKMHLLRLIYLIIVQCHQVMI